MALTLNLQLREQLKTRLNQFDAIKLDREGRKHAAVAFTLVDCSEPADIADIGFDAGAGAQAAFILTTRTVKLSSHAGQRAPDS